LLLDGVARQDGVDVELLADIDVALHDRIVGGLVDTSGFNAQEGPVEEGLRAAEALEKSRWKNVKQKNGGARGFDFAQRE
jgi:hypothetical protein